jgi:hypothetical protein
MSKVNSAPAPVIDRSRPKMVVTLGRGKVGKSVWLRWLAETAERKRPLRIVDADTNNPVLSQHFKEAERPPALDGDDKQAWIEQQFNELVRAATDDATRHDMLLDVGGNDILLKKLGAEVQIAEYLEESGVDPVAVHMVGTDEEDLRYLTEVEEKRLFCPKATVIVLNKGLVPSTRSWEMAFKPIIESAIIQKITSPARGAKIVVMPALGCMQQLEIAKLRSFKAALYPEGMQKVGGIAARRVRFWLEKEMPEMRAKIADYLP